TLELLRCRRPPDRRAPALHRLARGTTDQPNPPRTGRARRQVVAALGPRAESGVDPVVPARRASAADAAVGLVDRAYADGHDRCPGLFPPWLYLHGGR